MSLTSPCLEYRWTPRRNVRSPPPRPNSGQAAFHPSPNFATSACRRRLNVDTLVGAGHHAGTIRQVFTTLAACYAGGILRNHPFVDANKRTAWLLAMTFLDLNGYDLEAEMTDALQAVLALAAGTLAEEAFAAWLGIRLRRIGERQR
jgi:Fic/DOC family